MGAYIFALFHVLRGYRRRDLQPKSDTTIVARILTAYIVALILGTFDTGKGALITVFFAGLLPESALTWIREKSRIAFASDSAVEERTPLTELEGIDLYDRTRLAEEGVNDIQALATADLVHLMSASRLSARQLIDWTDQAMLYLQLGGDADRRPEAGRKRRWAPFAKKGTSIDTSPTSSDMPPNVRVSLNHLRSFGIRTATDLVATYRGDTDGPDAGDPTVEQQLRIALEPAQLVGEEPGQRIRTVVDALERQEWFQRIWNWRHSPLEAPMSWMYFYDGSGWDLKGPAAASSFLPHLANSDGADVSGARVLDGRP
jgi:hypothetical protein